MDMADRFGCDLIATGHYARVKHEQGRYFMAKGADEFKDQTYFLWMLSQEQLKRTIFPLGGYRKEEIRAMARERGLQALADKRESQEICFIPDNDYRRFLRENVPAEIESIGKGNFKDTEGNVLGQHHGYPFYTIGQRKGLEIAVGHPLYVLDIQKDTNTVVVGTREQLARDGMMVTGLVLSKYGKIPEGLEVQTKIRYRNKGHLSHLYNVYEGLRVAFDQPVSAIAPGQSAVFYEGDDMIGGGIIRRT
jgi:tRNA-specific 2-thiouridylase